MRYVVFVLMAVFGVVLSGSLASGLNIAGLQVDIVLLMVVGIAVLEKGYAPILFAAGCGLLMDTLYGPALGAYALSYTAAAAVVMILFRNTKRFNLLLLLAAGAGSYLVKEGVLAFIAYLLGARFSFMSLFVRNMLPSAALNAALALVAYALLSKLFSLKWMRPKVYHGADDFDLV